MRIDQPAASLSGFCSTEAAIRAGRARSRSSVERFHALCHVASCACPAHVSQGLDPTNETNQGDVPMAPQTTRNQISKGAAPRAAARQKAHVQESADKLAALKARQDGDQPTAEAPVEQPAASAPSPPPAEPQSKDPTVQFVIDGKPVGATQNRLSSISRVTATKDAPRWPAEQFRAWLAEQGVADPNHTEWEVTLPNGRKIAAVAKGGTARKAPAKKAAVAKKAAPAKAAAQVAKAS